MTYTEAYKELESIVREIERAEITVDELSAKITRATELLRICREKLQKTEDEVNKQQIS